MRLGLFCTYENPRRDYRAAYADQREVIRFIEQIGFDDVWVAEHHFNPDVTSPSCLTILAHLAAVTTRLRLGSAAVLLPFHDPIRVAEDVATVDILSQGRLDFGVGKGGPFPMQNKHFGVEKEHARAKLIESLDLIQELLGADSVRFEGRFFKADNLSVTPKPLQTPVPVFVATSTGALVRYAAERRHGLMGGPPFPLRVLRDMLDEYLDAAGVHAKLALIRFFHVAATRDAARGEGRELLRGFNERMQHLTPNLQPEWASWFDIDRLVDESLIGTPEEIRDKAARMQSELGLHSLILKPLHADIEKRKSDLELFANTLRP